MRRPQLHAWSEKQRFRKRTVVGQLNARLKDEFGGRLIYFRGAKKDHGASDVRHHCPYRRSILRLSG